MTHLGCFYFLLFLLLGFIANSRRWEPTKCKADRTLIQLNIILSTVCPWSSLSSPLFVHVVLPLLKLPKCWTVGPRYVCCCPSLGTGKTPNAPHFHGKWEQEKLTKCIRNFHVVVRRNIGRQKKVSSVFSVFHLLYQNTWASTEFLFSLLVYTQYIWYIFITSSSSFHGFITNQFNDLLPVGLLA